MDYAELYNNYWLSKDRMGSHSFANGPSLAREILDLCGSGKVLDVGSGMGLLVRSMLQQGVEAMGVDVSEVAVAEAEKLAPGHFFIGSILDLPFASDSFDIVVSTDCLEHIAETQIAHALSELRRVARRFIYLRLATTHDRDNRWHLSVRPREWWESACHDVGLRKHPAYFRANSFEALEHDGWQISIPLEKVPNTALEAYPLSRLKAERDLHMDMFRETGRRSEAHVVRYHLAANLVRDGDVVLDAACGLGYGSHLLQTTSPAARVLGVDSSKYAVEYATAMYGKGPNAPEFHQGMLPEWLGTLPSHSVDFIASFETLEHVSDPLALLAEFRRILSPGGRIVVSVPLDWTEPNGRDPNPHHMHVYDWSRIYREVSENFLVERSFALSASRRKTGPAGQRLWEPTGRSLKEFSPQLLQSDSGPDCEWCVLVGMRDPVDEASVPYLDKQYHRDTVPAGWNTTAFARDYLNPWLIRSMVTIGQRASSPELRKLLSEKVLMATSCDEARQSADRGAALCVAGYALLEQQEATAGEIDEFTALVNSYCALPPVSPHALRWQVSLSYLLGRLRESCGDFSGALGYYESCARMNAVAFNPVLATKTVNSCLRAGLLHHAAGRTDPAKAAWRQGIELAQTAVSQNWTDIVASLDQPMEFALPEMSAVVEYASSCAYALNHVDVAQTKPCQWWWQHRRDRISQLAEIRSMLTQATKSAGEIERLNKEIHRLNTHIQEREKYLHVQTEEIRQKDEIHRQQQLALCVLAKSRNAGFGSWHRGLISIRHLISRTQRKQKHRPVLYNLELPVDFSNAPAVGKLVGWVFSTVQGDPVLAIRLVHQRKVFVGQAHLPRADVAAVYQNAGPIAGFEIDYNFVGLRTAEIQIETLHSDASWRVLDRRTIHFSTAERSQFDNIVPYQVRLPCTFRPYRPKVLHAVANFMVGGSSRLIVDLIENLGGDYEQFVLTSFSPSPASFTGVDLMEIKMSDGLRAVVAYIRKISPALIHVHYWGDVDQPWYALVFKAAEKLNIPVFQNINTPVEPFVSPSIRRNIYVSETVRRDFGGLLPMDAEEVIYPGSDFAHFSRPDDETPPNDCVGMVYRLENDKLNVDAIQPFIHCVARRPTTRVLIVGGGSLLEPFRSAVSKAGLADAFEFTGYVSYRDLPAFYRRMSLFAAPVHKESFGQVTPFAMSMRLPVVGYDVGAISEIIDDPEMLAPPGDAVALGNLMAQLLDDHAQRLTIGARNAIRARTLFSLDGMIRRYRHLYCCFLDSAP